MLILLAFLILIILAMVFSIIGMYMPGRWQGIALICLIVAVVMLSYMVGVLK